jgi:glycosyltransferase involved in cell wall biosynthesis
MIQAAQRDLEIACVSTFPPRACGIGTFTRDLVQGLRALPQPTGVVIAAINGDGEHYDYAATVRVQMEEGDPASYVAAARRLNGMRRVEVVSLQHEFGKYGVWCEDVTYEDYVAPMLAAFDKPVVVTLHTVMPAPRAGAREAVRAIGERAAAIVVMANIAKVLLEEEYGLDEQALAKVHHIPHGVPACVGTRTPPTLEAAKRVVGLAGHRILSTFGLINAGKGIEYMIDAIPALVVAYPDVLYLVIGETHPEVRKQEGERYRNELRARCRRLGVEQSVRFVNRFLPQAELVRYLAATDVYVTPYLSRDQITSGTLAYALGCGKAIVSTPYLYATEALAEGRGLLAEARNAESLGSAIDQLLGNLDLRRYVESQAAGYGRAMAWPVVAAQYRELFASVR